MVYKLEFIFAQVTFCETGILSTSIISVGQEKKKTSLGRFEKYSTFDFVWKESCRSIVGGKKAEKNDVREEYNSTAGSVFRIKKEKRDNVQLCLLVGIRAKKKNTRYVLKIHRGIYGTSVLRL